MGSNKLYNDVLAGYIPRLLPEPLSIRQISDHCSDWWQLDVLLLWWSMPC